MSLPNITGEFWGRNVLDDYRVDIWAVVGGNSGCFSSSVSYRIHAVSNQNSSSSGTGTTTLKFQASKSNTIYSGTKVTPLSQTCRFLMRY